MAVVSPTLMHWATVGSAEGATTRALRGTRGWMGSLARMASMTVRASAIS
jgi:hypothetical protein